MQGIGSVLEFRVYGLACKPLQSRLDPYPHSVDPKPQSIANSGTPKPKATQNPFSLNPKPTKSYKAQYTLQSTNTEPQTLLYLSKRPQILNPHEETHEKAAKTSEVLHDPTKPYETPRKQYVHVYILYIYIHPTKKRIAEISNSLTTTP